MNKLVEQLSGQNGQAIFTEMIAMVAFVVILLFSVDLGVDYAHKADMQKSVDAAALAGAQLLPHDPDGAEEVARAYAAANGVKPEDDLDVSLTSTHVANDTVTVTVRRSVAQRFTSILGLEFVLIKADASALIGSATGLKNFIPFGIKKSVLDPLGHSDPVTLVYNSNDQTQGNSIAIAFPGNVGGDDFRESIFDGSQAPFCVAGSVRRLPDCPLQRARKHGRPHAPGLRRPH